MREIFAHIEARAEDYVGRLVRACAQPSISAAGHGLQAMAHPVRHMLEGIGFELELLAIRSGADRVPLSRLVSLQPNGSTVTVRL